MLIGNIPLRDLTAHDVRRALNKLAETRSTRSEAVWYGVTPDTATAVDPSRA